MVEPSDENLSLLLKPAVANGERIPTELSAFDH